MTQCNTYIAKAAIGTDGRKLLAGKCVESDGAGAGLAKLDLRANVEAGISWNVPTVDDLAACLVPCCLEWDCPSTVQLSAQTSVNIDGRTWFFDHWIVDGGPRIATQQVEITLDGCHRAVAVYVPTDPCDVVYLCALLPPRLTATLVEFKTGIAPPLDYACGTLPWLRMNVYPQVVGTSVRVAQVDPPPVCNSSFPTIAYGGETDVCDSAACIAHGNNDCTDCVGSDPCVGCPRARVTPEIGKQCLLGTPVGTPCSCAEWQWQPGDDVDDPFCWWGSPQGWIEVPCRGRAYSHSVYHRLLAGLNVGFWRSGALNPFIFASSGYAMLAQTTRNQQQGDCYDGNAFCSEFPDVVIDCGQSWAGSVLGEVPGNDTNTTVCNQEQRPLNGAPFETCADKINWLVRQFPIYRRGQSYEPDPASCAYGVHYSFLTKVDL